MSAQNGAYRKINGQWYLLRPRAYILDLAHTGVASTTATGSIQIDSSSPFLMVEKFISDTIDPALIAPGLDGQYNNEIQIQDSSNSYLWSNDFQSRAGFARDRRHGHRLQSEVIIAADTRLVATIREPAAAAAAGITKIQLDGYSLTPVNMIDAR